MTGLKNIENRAAQAEKKLKEKDENKVVQLPFWPEMRRALPNDAARSALFTTRRGKRELLEQKPVFVVGNGEITYTGGELRAADDELVWLQILHYARYRPLGTWIEFTPYQLCKDIGWATSSVYYKRVRTCLDRLKATSLSIHNKRIGQGLSVSLIDEFEWKDDDGKKLPKYRVTLAKGVHQWFGDKHYTQIEWDHYKQLSATARRLYDYARSHENPFALKLTTVQELCGSTYSQTRDLRRNVRKALKELVDQGLIAEGDVDKIDRVHFKR